MKSLASSSNDPGLQKCAKNDVDCLIGVLKGEDIVASRRHFA